MQSLENLRWLQASALPYFDVLWVLIVVTVSLVFAVSLVKRSLAEKDIPIGAE